MDNEIKQIEDTEYNFINKIKLDQYIKLFERNRDIADIKYVKTYMCKPPVYYLFDGYINENIGSSSEHNKNVAELLDIFDNTHIIPKNITYSTHPTHATIFYKFDYNNKYYIYYSNSGLGINNNITINNCVAPKVYYTLDKTSGENFIKVITLLYKLLLTFDFPIIRCFLLITINLGI